MISIVKIGLYILVASVDRVELKVYAFSPSAGTRARAL